MGRHRASLTWKRAPRGFKSEGRPAHNIIQIHLNIES